MSDLTPGCPVVFTRDLPIIGTGITIRIGAAGTFMRFMNTLAVVKIASGHEVLITTDGIDVVDADERGGER